MNIDLNTFPVTIDVLHVGLAVLALLFFILFVAKKSPAANNEAVTAEPVIEESVVEEPTVEEPTVEEETAEVPQPAQLKEANTDAALQLLALLQQDARFIDFIQEDLSSFSDADIGAAARVVHEGS